MAIGKSLAAIALVVLIAWAPMLCAQEYDIRLTRPTHVGAQYQIVASGQISSTMSTITYDRAMVISTISSLSIQIEGVVTILEVDERKREKKLQLVVASCSMSEEEGELARETLPRGAIIVVESHNGEREILIDGKAPTPNIAKMIELLSLVSTSDHTDDDLLGMSTPQKIGSNWTVRNAVLAKELSKNGLSVKEEDVRGIATLDAVETVQNTDCLRISAATEVTQIDLPLPPEMNVVQSQISFNVSGAFPIDTTIRPLSTNQKMTMLLIAKGKPRANSAEVTMVAEDTRSVQIEYTPL